MSDTPFAAIRFRDVLQAARARDASDVHLHAGVPPVLRVDGALHSLGQPPVSPEELETIARSLLGEANRARLEETGECTIARSEPEIGELRAHVYRAAHGFTVAVRLLQRQIPPLDALGLPESVADLAARERGLAIVAGPTGSGKSTTLAALVELVNTNAARRIVTLEDPIEYRYTSRRSLVTQREIGRDTPSLAAALHGVLRADPDVIVVGEIRDAEAIRGALTAAETGHLVLTTIHTGDAPQTIDRIVDAFSGQLAEQVRTQLAHVLLAVVCQRLVARADGNGRCAAVEVLVGTDAVRNLIRDSKTHQLKNAIATGRRFGMQTLEQHLAELVEQRRISAAEAARAVR